MEKFIIYNKRFKKGKDIYNYIIEEVWYDATKSRKKFYLVKKNGDMYLHTSLWQTWKKYIRNIGS